METLDQEMLIISIHAPVWGATKNSIKKTILNFNFNSRSRVGSDFRFLSFQGIIILFQFTLPCGERPVYGKTLYVRDLFQFTLPCGERLLSVFYYVMIFLFQFTLPCGERLKILKTCVIAKYISIHAPVWGATLMLI